MSLFSLSLDIAKMNPALSTALQSWSRRKLLIIVSFLIAAHIAVFFMGVIVAPSMFHDAEVPGTVCVKQDPPESNSGKEVYKASKRHSFGQQNFFQIYLGLSNKNKMRKFYYNDFHNFNTACCGHFKLLLN